MSNYNIQLVKKQELKKKLITRTQFNITKKQNQMIGIEDVEKIYNQFLDRGIDPERIGIIGLNGERLTTIKSPNSTELFNYFDDDYLDGKSNDIKEKLTKFFNIQLIIY